MKIRLDLDYKLIDIIKEMSLNLYNYVIEAELQDYITHI